MDLACKDAGFAIEFGRRFGVPLRLAAVMEQTFIEGRARYGGGAWASVIGKLLEGAGGAPLRAPGFPARAGSGDPGSAPGPNFALVAQTQQKRQCGKFPP